MSDRFDSLMQAVLDGVATPDEVREVEARVAGSPAARERFEELRAVFDGLRRVPKAFPPEGLVASVLAALPADGRHARDDDQLFDTSGVIGASSRNVRDGRSRRSDRFIRVLQPWVFPRGTAMNERNNGMSVNRKIMIGGGLAIAAAAVAVSLGVFPPNSSETAGTIVPAQRYRAAQPADLQGGAAPNGGDTQAGQQAPAGTAGTQGTQGTLGTLGTQGTQGTLGTQGTQGTLGTLGTQGTQGTLGTQGTQGTLGTLGTQGTQGTQGTLGTLGTQGTQGTQGTLGTQGTQGTLGTQGTQGTQGTLGTLGTQGTLGTLGTQGTQGTQGTLGTLGTQGTQGTLGTQGTQAMQGTQSTVK
jgi:hypothetical protein